MMDLYDVIVVGGGPSGCAAAVAAAREGMSVLLAEKYGFLGGSAVASGVCCILSKNTADFEGVWHNFMRRLAKYGGVYEDELTFSDKFDFYGTVDPEMVKFAWEDLLLEHGVLICYHVTVTGAIKNGNEVIGINCDFNGVKLDLYAKRVIDCSGDGVVSEYAGVEWEQGGGTNKCAMSLTKMFRLGNISRDAGPHSQSELDKVHDDWENAVERGDYTNPIVTSGRILNYIHKNGLRWKMPRHMNQILIPTSRILNTDPLDMYALSKAEIEGRKQISEIADFYRRYVPGCEISYIIDSCEHIGVRSSRRIHGIDSLCASDAVNFKKRPDSIARASWDIDVWPRDSYTAPPVPWESDAYKTRLEKLRNGEYFDVPYGCIVASCVENLLLAGRIISSDNIAQSSIRIQQTCMSLGEAAGFASALSIKKDIYPSLLEGREVSSLLRNIRASITPAFNFDKILHTIQSDSR